MKKRIVALLMGSMMIVSLLGGCGSKETEKEPAKTEQEEVSAEVNDQVEEAESVVEKDYSEHIDFSITSYYSMYTSSAGHDLSADPVIEWVQDKFNVSVESWACDSATAKEEVRLWVNGGTMPNCMTWPEITPAELQEYADQELIQPLPEGWEEKWPNLAKMVEETGYSELVKVDGLTYGIPHAQYGNFNQIPAGMINTGLYIRKDWAKQVGLTDLGADGTISLAELKEYLEKVGDAGLCENPTLGGNVGYLMSAFRLANGINGDDFIASDAGYIWGPQQEGYVAAMQEFQDWYKTGLVDQDFYTKESLTGLTEFREGMLAALFHTCNIGEVQLTIEALMTQDGLEGADLTDVEKRAPYYDKLAIVAIEGEDGTVYTQGNYNFWMISSFSPQTDEATMERILDMLDYMCTKEGQVLERMGIPGQDFTIDENGVITTLNEAITTGEYKVSPSRFFNVWGYCGDDVAFAEGIKGRYLADQNIIKENIAIKSEGVIFPMDDVVTALATDAKKNYSVDIASAMAELVVNGADVEAGVASFIETNKNLWQPVVDDLNAQ